MQDELNALLDEVQYILGIDYNPEKKPLHLSKDTVDSLRQKYEAFISVKDRLDTIIAVHTFLNPLDSTEKPLR